ncbi:MAG: hypothetical protein JWP15_3170, partial [Alphaproteobacteria bacterium]|nr:hypothetical protein [Alphaproteobacteria bacterium]
MQVQRHLDADLAPILETVLDAV